MVLNYFCCLNKITWHLEDILFPVSASLLPGLRLFLIVSFWHLRDSILQDGLRDVLLIAHGIPPSCHEALTSVAERGNWQGGSVEKQVRTPPPRQDGEGQGQGGRNTA